MRKGFIFALGIFFGFVLALMTEAIVMTSSKCTKVRIGHNYWRHVKSKAELFGHIDTLNNN